MKGKCIIGYMFRCKQNNLVTIFMEILKSNSFARKFETLISNVTQLRDMQDILLDLRKEEQSLVILYALNLSGNEVEITLYKKKMKIKQENVDLIRLISQIDTILV